MKKFFMFCFVLLLIVPLVALAQDVEVDIQAYLNAASLIFMTGIGGMAVMALVEVIKRIIGASGIAVRIISVVVSAGATVVYEMGKGFELLEFVILTVLVALAANGIYLFPKQKPTY